MLACGLGIYDQIRFKVPGQNIITEKRLQFGKQVHQIEGKSLTNHKQPATRTNQTPRPLLTKITSRNIQSPPLTPILAYGECSVS